jgi:acetyl-CoA carboxylase biotin carboxyl carrier protein
MDRDRYIPTDGNAEAEELYPSQEEQSASVISIEQLQRLVRLLDQSSVSELELKHVREGTRLVLRKASGPENSESSNGNIPAIQLVAPIANDEADAAPTAVEHKIVAHLVGTFHVWARPRGGTLVAVGDRIKEGQLVGTIESLNVFNEVESPVAGQVVEIFVQEGQPVEYGQLLMTVSSSVQE